MIIRNKFVLFAVFFCVAASAGSSGSALSQSLPAVDFRSGQLVSPTQANAYFSTLLDHTETVPESARSSGLSALAIGLGAEQETEGNYIRNVYSYVSRNIETEFRYGLSKGSFGAFIDQSGTAFDQAELMVDLLEYSGIQAIYELGTITLSSQEFGAWSGLVFDLEEGAQDFRVDASAACQFLANGGIPAIINNQVRSECDYSGDLSSVTLGHIWVRVGTEVYDPSYKAHYLYEGVDISAALGCNSTGTSTCGTDLVSAALGGAQTGYDSTASAYYIQNLNTAQLTTTLNSYATTLQQYIHAMEESIQDPALHGVQISRLTGGREVSNAQLLPASSTLPYPAQVQRTWSGPVPDPYRVAIGLTFDTLSETLFLDDVYGYALGISSGAQASGSDHRWVLGVEGDLDGHPFWRKVIASAQSSADFDGPELWPNGTPTLAINATFPYPDYGSGAPGGSPNYAQTYAVHVGNYANGSTIFAVPALIVVQAGHLTPSSERRSAAMVANIPNTPHGFIACDPDNYASDTGCRSFYIAGDLQTYATSWGAQSSMVRRIIDEVNNVNSQHHLTVGIGNRANAPAAQTLFSAPSLLSTTSRTGNDADQRAATQSMAASMSALEGGVARQQYDSWLAGSATSLVRLANDDDVRFYSANTGNISSIMAATQDYGSFGTDFANSLFSTPGRYGVVPRSGRTGNFTGLDGSQILVYIAGIISVSPDAQSISFAASNGAKGAGSSPSLVPLETTFDALSSRTEAMGYSAEFSPSTSSMTLTPPPDITVGRAEFPYSLSFQRYYDSASGHLTPINWIYQDLTGFSTGTNISTSMLTPGWDHNLNIRARVTHPAYRVLGDDVAIEAVMALSAIQGLRDLYLSNDKFHSLVTSAILAEVAFSYPEGAGVNISMPPNSIEFLRMPNGDWRPNGQSQASIEVVNWHRNEFLVSAHAIHNYTGMSFRVRMPDRSVIFFQSAGEDSIRDATAYYFYEINDFVVDHWDFPTGMSVDFEYSTFQTGGSGGGTYHPDYPFTARSTASLVRRLQLSEVSNSLGRALSFTTSGGIFSRQLTVSDDNGRQIEFLRASPSTPPSYTDDDMNYELFTDLSGEVWQYNYNLPIPPLADQTGVFPDILVEPFSTQGLYEAGAAVQLVSTRLGPRLRLVSIVPPGVNAAPILTASYDDGFRLATLADAEGNETQFASSRFGGEIWSRARTVDPLGAVTEVEMNEDGAATMSISARGVRELNAYDSFGRLVDSRTGFSDWPLSRYDSRTTIEYDAMHNPVRQAVHPGTDANGTPHAGLPLETVLFYNHPTLPTLPTRTISPAGNATVTCYSLATNEPECAGRPLDNDDRGGLAQALLGPSGEETLLEYDSYGRVIRERVRVED